MQGECRKWPALAVYLGNYRGPALAYSVVGVEIPRGELWGCLSIVLSGFLRHGGGEILSKYPDANLGRDESDGRTSGIGRLNDRGFGEPDS